MILRDLFFFRIVSVHPENWSREQTSQNRLNDKLYAKLLSLFRIKPNSESNINTWWLKRTRRPNPCYYNPDMITDFGK